MVAFSYIGPLIYHTNQVSTNLADYLVRPSSKHLLGYDDVGYDDSVG